MQNLIDIFKNFQGNWKFERHYTNDVTAFGTAQFLTTDDSHVLDYKEYGTSTIAGKQQDFQRSFTYKLEDDAIAVYYADSKNKDSLYQKYQLAEQGKVLRALEAHDCSMDIYEGRYDITDEDHFVLTTTVKSLEEKTGGYKKDYVMTTHYTRA